MFKFDLVLVLAAVIAGALWIEHGHRIVIDAPDTQASSVAVAGTCPENDTMPYNANCLAFLKLPAESSPRLRVVLREATAAAPCPDSDGVPYTASCLAFLKGATDTGMRWRVTDTPQIH